MLSFFSRISRVGRLARHASCLHECMNRENYDEQREREMQSISSLLMCETREQSRKTHEVCTMFERSKSEFI